MRHIKKTIASIILTSLLISTSTVSVNAFNGIMQLTTKQVPAEPPVPYIPYADIYVDDDNINGPWDGTQKHPYQYIRDGIENSNPGDIIFVFSGIYNCDYHNTSYYEKVIINKSITLIGQDRDTTIIDFRNYGGVIIQYTDQVTINKFTIRRGGPGVYTEDSYNCVITKNKIENSINDGILIDHSSKYVTISDNIIINNHFRGIDLDGSYNTIVGNTIADSGNFGIDLDGSYNTISDNIINGCERGINGYHTAYTTNHTITGNLITNFSSDGIMAGSYYNITGNTIANGDGAWPDGIIAGSNCNIIGNTITNINGSYFSGGITAWSHCTITGNTITNLNSEDVAHGIVLFPGFSSDVAKCVVTENIITNFAAGADATGIISIPLRDSTIAYNIIANMHAPDDAYADGIYTSGGGNNIITGNSISSCYGCGIYAEDTKSNVIKENTITDNWCGLVLDRDEAYTTYNTVSENTITGHVIGILFWNSEDTANPVKYNTLSKNNIIDNYCGLYMSNASSNKIIANNIKDNTMYGIYGEKSSRNNQIYYNNFINNGNPGEGGNAYDEGTNIWYKFKLLGKSKGNYWDDFEDNEGYPNIYIIPPHQSYSNDRYPSMDPIDTENINVNYKMTNDLTIEKHATQEQTNTQFNTEEYLSTFIDSRYSQRNILTNFIASSQFQC